MLCQTCLTEKILDDFSFRNKEKSIRRNICKSCHSVYRKTHYRNNKEKYLKKALEWNKKQGKILSKYIFEELLKSHCIDCTEKDILVLEFDHLSNKKFSIAEMYQNRYSLIAVKEEIKKCVVRCANCHRRKTAKETGFWKYKMTQE